MDIFLDFFLGNGPVALLDCIQHAFSSLDEQRYGSEDDIALEVN